MGGKIFARIKEDLKECAAAHVWQLPFFAQWGNGAFRRKSTKKGIKVEETA